MRAQAILERRRPNGTVAMRVRYTLNGTVALGRQFREPQAALAYFERRVEQEQKAGWVLKSMEVPR